jgi:hypothetical protein
VSRRLPRSLRFGESTTIAAERECASFFFFFQATGGRGARGSGTRACGGLLDLPLYLRSLGVLPALWRGPRPGTPLSSVTLKTWVWHVVVLVDQVRGGVVDGLAQPTVPCFSQWTSLLFTYVVKSHVQGKKNVRLWSSANSSFCQER